MKTTMKYLIYTLLLIGVFVSCKKPNTYNETEKGYTYFGMEQGRFVEYHVQYMNHDSLLNQHDTLEFYYKTVIGDEYIDNEGRKGYEFLRYKKDSLNGDYTFLSKWAIFLADNKAQLVEENQRKVKLVFPVKKNQIWDVNMYNSLGQQNTHYETTHTSLSYSNLNFDSTSTVEYKRFKTLIDDQLEQEIYAKGVGMIYKISRELQFQFGIPTPYKGTEWYYTIVNFGVE